MPFSAAYGVYYLNILFCIHRFHPKNYPFVDCEHRNISWLGVRNGQSRACHLHSSVPKLHHPCYLYRAQDHIFTCGLFTTSACKVLHTVHSCNVETSWSSKWRDRGFWHCSMKRCWDNVLSTSYPPETFTSFFSSSTDSNRFTHRHHQQHHDSQELI